MRYSLILAACCLAAAAAAQPTVPAYFIGTRYTPGDTAWYRTHLLSIAEAGVVKGNPPTRTRMEQTVYHHQYAIAQTDSQTVLITIYDSMAVAFTNDNGQGIVYSSTGKNDSAVLMSMVVYPLRCLLHRPLTVYLHASGKVDSVQGLDAILDDATRPLARSSQIEQVRAALNPRMISDLLAQSLSSLPNKTMTAKAPEHMTRARMIGRTQFLDNIAVQLLRVSGDTAFVKRITFTKIASPTITYDGHLCVIDSTDGSGGQDVTLDLRRGLILTAQETFDNYVRAGVMSSNTMIQQTTSLRAEEQLERYATLDPRHAVERRKPVRRGRRQAAQ